MLDNLHFQAHKKLDGFTALLRMIALNIDNKVVDSKWTLF